MAGSALSAHALCPEARVIGVEPAGADDAARSFALGSIQRCDDPQTIADGARTPFVGKLNFQVFQQHVTDIVTQDDAALIRAMRFVWERMKLLIEPTAALPFAALLGGRVPARGLRVGVIASGGNMDPVAVGRLFEGSR